MQESENVAFAPQTGGKPASAKLFVWVHVVCGWPLIMIAFGGAIGGGLGGVAYGVNLYIYKSRLPLAAKVALILVTGLAAIFLWATIASAIHSRRR